MQTMVLMEEVDGYKKKLKCPICNIEEKDAILTKCFHVFCYKCLKTRYETRPVFTQLQSDCGIFSVGNIFPLLLFV